MRGGLVKKEAVDAVVAPALYIDKLAHTITVVCFLVSFAVFCFGARALFTPVHTALLPLAILCVALDLERLVELHSKRRVANRPRDLI